MNMNKSDTLKYMKIIWRFAKSHIGLFGVSELCILILYAVSLLLPLNLVRLVDSVLKNGQFSLLPTVIRDYIILFLISAIINLLYAFVWQTLNNRYVTGIKNEMFRKILFAEPVFLTNMNSGDFMSRIDYDAEQFINIIQRNLFHFMNSILLCAGIIIIVAKINFIFSLVLIIAAILPIVFTRQMGKRTQIFSNEKRQLTGTLTGRIFEILKGFQEIRLLCAESWAKSQLMTSLKRIVTLDNRIRRMDFFTDKGTYLVNLLTSLIVYGYSTYLILNHRFTVGLFLAMIEYIALFHKKFNWILRIYLDWFGRKVSVERVNEILECESESDNGEKIENIISIAFNDVCFKHEESGPVLENVSFVINQGEQVALAGVSGAGKTTIIGLMTGLYKPSSGEILVNGISLSNIKRSSLRKAFAVVSQNIFLFDETIRYNLNMGASYPDEELWHVLEIVELREMVEGFSEGLDTKIGALGRNLSGGQKQRITLARALLKQKGFIVLDEAASALDVMTENIITKRVAAYSKDITLLLISHRQASLEFCKRVILLNNKTIAADGSHDELNRHSDAYQVMFGMNGA